jgi:chaperonin cofactor prefoldin
MILSTLTKILIVLLTLSSVFLCGIVVTYVANAQDYRELAKSRKRQLDAAKLSASGDKERLALYTAKSDRLQTRLTNDIASLKREISTLNSKITSVEREKAKLLQELTSWASIAETANQTATHQTDLFKGAQTELLQVKAQQEKDAKELEDLAGELNVKMAIIATLEAEKKQLQEQLSDLQGRLDRFLLGLGKEPVPPVSVTPVPDKAQPVPPDVMPTPPVAKKIELKGLLTDVNLKHSYAQISIGAAQGVKDGMRFFVTRGSEFVCEILIIDVDAEEAVGVMERIQSQPKVGDSVSTNL